MSEENYKWDPYERMKAPEPPQQPRHFNIWRPFKLLIFLYLKLSWRAWSLSITNWYGKRDRFNNNQEINHVDDVVSLWLVHIGLIFAGTCVLSAFFAGFVQSFVVLGIFAFTHYIFMFFVSYAFNLHSQEARDYWTETLT